VSIKSIWIKGVTRSGKTTRLVNIFSEWVKQEFKRNKASKIHFPKPLTPAILVFSANDDNKRELADQLSQVIPGSYPFLSKTPLGFISDEVILFWPLLFETLQLKAQFPLKLRPETEQELATRLWHSEILPEDIELFGSEFRFVRRILDLLQLAGASGILPETIPDRLESGLPQLWQNLAAKTPLFNPTQRIGDLLLNWRKWCLERGLLTYGLIYELYWRYLLPNSVYQGHLTRRFQAIFADNVDDYPAIAQDIFTFLLDQGKLGVFTYNPDGKVRLGLNADPHYLENISKRCQIEEIPLKTGLAEPLGESIIKLVTDPSFIIKLPNSIQTIQTISRADLLRKVADTIIEAIKKGEIQPQEIGIIAPGLDEIARYTFLEIFSHQNIPIEPLNEQRPLISSPLVRGLLTLLGLIYPGNGRLIDRDSVAEMLVILSQKPQTKGFLPEIDPVRGGLLADTCYHLDPDYPRLLPVETFQRWDRLGHRATTAYQNILKWIEDHQILIQKNPIPNPIVILDHAIKYFLANGNYLTYDQLSPLRELVETAQHYWEVDRRLRQNEPQLNTPMASVGQFIKLLRQGTITANPRPFRPLGNKIGAITLATIFQYRSLRSSHRWQFWLDAGSVLWSQGGASNLFAAPLFLREWEGKPWCPEDDILMDQERLNRIIWDLLGRTTERVYLCHSDLGVNGNEQLGPLSMISYQNLKDEE
jgi:hypothetical protein